MRDQERGRFDVLESAYTTDPIQCFACSKVVAERATAVVLAVLSRCPANSGPEAEAGARGAKRRTKGRTKRRTIVNRSEKERVYVSTLTRSSSEDRLGVEFYERDEWNTGRVGRL